MMKFMSQIKTEILNIFKHKFLLIIGILMIAASILFPIGSMFVQINPNDWNSGPRPYYVGAATKAAYANGEGYISYGGGDPNAESITVDGVTITSDNPFYWNIKNDMDEKNNVSIDKGRFSTPEAIDLYMDLLDSEVGYYLHFAKAITKPEDYRVQLAWTGMDKLYDKFFYEHNDVKEDVLMEVANNRKGMDPAAFKKQYIQITAEEKQAALDKVDAFINTVFSVADNNDFAKYIDLSIQAANDNINSVKEQIAIQEQAIIDNPSQEENLNNIIEDMKKQITMIETTTIPTLQYRLQKHIVPGENIWQNNALADVENYKNQLLYQVIVSEDKFVKDMGLVQEYKTYDHYKTTVQAQIDNFNNKILIAQKSLDADQPDMKYVSNGSRSKTVSFLDYSVVIALFSIIVGGWIMASEFQQGTIRLLMIRPKTRIKILMSKFTGALLLCLAMYVAGCVLNLLVNGICYGFTDFGYPNYTISGGVNFFAYYIPQFFACMVPIVFAYTVAFMLSVASKNIAVSISVPIACFVLCVIGMVTLQSHRVLEWLAYTPLPYVQLSSIFIANSPVQSLMERGFPVSVAYGIIMLLVLSAIFTFISAWVFKKRDITN